MAVTCRANNCGMQFANVHIRKRHEEQMHRGMFEQAVDRLLKQVHASHKAEDLERKVFQTATGKKLSYNEITQLDRDSAEYSEVSDVFKGFIEGWLEQTPNTNIEDFFRRARFRIQGG